MKVLFVSLGCDKNLVDSEMMLGILSNKGYTITDDETQADVIVVNTCCFIHDAKEESVAQILEMADLKKEGNAKVLVVTGCMAEKYRAEILEEIPEVDAVLGTNSFDEIAAAIEKALGGERMIEMKELKSFPEVEANRLVTTGGHYAYLKIAEGCDKHCTYCIIPSLRGDYRSIPMEELLKEANRLVDFGVEEIILVAQETTVYGEDIYGKKKLPTLLKELSKIEELKWIRILYCYPEEITDELIQTIKEEDKVVDYLDLPIQHCNDEILKKMGRRTSKKQLVDIITKLRKEIPDICLRTSLITGFPGETREQHGELLDFVEEMKFDRLGVFTYSKEDDTPAAQLPDQIDEAIKLNRQEELMELQQTIAFKASEDMIGKEILVMIEGKIVEDDAYVGRTYKDAPGVDGLIFVNTDAYLDSGDFVKVRVSEALDYDLIGELVE